MSYSSSGDGLNLICRLFQTVSELKTYIFSQYVEMEHTLAEKRRNLLCYTPKPHSHALNDVIMHKTHWIIVIDNWIIVRDDYVTIPWHCRDTAVTAVTCCPSRVLDRHGFYQRPYLKHSVRSKICTSALKSVTCTCKLMLFNKLAIVNTISPGCDNPSFP